MSIYIDELKELQLYNRDFFAPIEKSNKKKGSCVFLLTPDQKSSFSLIGHPKMSNFNMFESYYTERDINLILNSKSQIVEESVLLEDKLKASERTDFGLPEKKKYPMPDKAHVLSAIKFFNYVSPEDEKTLARNINKKIKEYNMKDAVHVSEKNRFHKYFSEAEIYYAPEKLISENGLVYNEDYLQTANDLIIFNESNPKFNARLKNIIFKERIKSNQDLMKFYDKVQEELPVIKRTYANLELYKQYNLFVDFAYYSELFFKKNILKKDKGLEFYFDFVDRFINDSRYLLAGYTKRTVFIPVDGWKVEDKSDVWDYTKNINPISLIYRWVRSGSLELAKNWNSIDFLFLGNNGYFRARMEHLDTKNINKFLNNIKKLINKEMIQDDSKESAEAITADIVNNLEGQTGIKIHNLTGASKKLTQEELIDKVSKAINSGSDEDRKDALVSYIKATADHSKDADDAAEQLKNDEYLKNLISQLSTNSDSGLNFSATRRARLNTINDKFLSKTVNGKSIEELIEDSSINTEIPKTDIPIESIDDEWNGLSFTNFEKSYDINQDIFAIITFFSNKKYPLTAYDFKTEDISTSEDLLYLYTVNFEDAFGKRFKLQFEIPKFRDGRYMRLRGNDKIITNQLILLPVIKTDEDTAQVVSNYNKIFIRRYGSTTGKSCVTADKLHKALRKYMEAKHTKIKIRTGDNSRISAKYDLPIDYVDLSSAYSSIEIGDTKIYFDQDELRKDFPNVDYKNNFYFSAVKGKLATYGNSEDEFVSGIIAQILCTDENFKEIYENTSEASKYTYSMASILDAKIPLIVVMGYSEGLQSSLKKANITYRIEDKRPKLNKDFEDFIRFNDGYLVYRLDYNSSLLMNGLKTCNTEEYSLADIDNKAMWLDFLDLFGGRILADGLDNFYDLMMDPITVTVCKQCNLPTDYISILAYANSLLADNKYNRHIDITGNRMRSNEIVAGYLYKAMSKAYGDYTRQLKRNRKETTFSMKRSAVIDLIFLDPTESDSSVINPVLDFEATAQCSFKGLSGMNSDRSYGLDKRTYDKSMLNVLAMSTGFAGNVGLSRWATIDSAIAGKRGYIKTDTSAVPQMSDAKTLSMTEAMTPYGTTSDDPFRTAMTFIQTSKHSMRVNKAMPMLVSNGADEALPYLTSDTFAHKAKANGVVKELTDDYMIVEYTPTKTKSGAVGTTSSYEFIDLREQIKKNSDGGYFEVLKLDTDFKKGQKIKAGQIIAYDKLAYSDDFSSGDNIAYNVGTLSKIAILVTDEGFEDSAIIDDDLSEMMSSDIVLLKDTFLDAKTNVYYMAKKGQAVQEGDPLLIFQNAFDADDANALIKNLSADQDEINEIGRITLKSKVTGVVQDIKIYRTVEVNELSPSLKKMVNDYESKITSTKKTMEKYKIDSSSYDSNTKLDATGKLKKSEGKILIEFYLKYHDKMAVGDKLVYYSALKGVVKDIFPKGKEPYTDRRPKEKVRSLLTASSVSRRMVGSIIKVGSIQKLMVELDRAVKDIYGIKYPDNIE